MINIIQYQEPLLKEINIVTVKPVVGLILTGYGNLVRLIMYGLQSYLLSAMF